MFHMGLPLLLPTRVADGLALLLPSYVTHGIVTRSVTC